MNTLKHSIRLAIAGAALALAGCSGIGEGSTVQSMQLAFAPVDIRDQGAVAEKGTPSQYLRMFDCFCSNIGIYGTFTDHTLANFSLRAKWTSSDPTVVSVSNYGEASLETACPLAQRTAGLLRPHKPGTATITAEYLGFKPTFEVHVIDTLDASANPAQTLTLAPADPTNTGAAVGALLPLKVSATLDSSPRTLNLNVTSWTITPEDTTVAAIDSIGQLAAYAADQGTPRHVTAHFGACSTVAEADVRLGQVASMTITHEPSFSTDDKLAQYSNESLVVTGSLDYDDNGATPNGTQVLSNQTRADFTDPCTIREYDATVPTTFCKETATPACASKTPLCSTASATACTSGMEACRTVAAPMAVLGQNRIVAQTPSDDFTTFFSTFPASHGVSTTITSGISDTAASVTVASLNGYPAALPFQAVLEKGTANEEIVKITAVSGTTLTIDRGIYNTTAVAHASGAAFDQRTVTSDSVQVQSVAGSLTQVAIDTPGSTTIQPFATLQLESTGTFEDSATSTTRTQRVTRLSEFSTGPGLNWSINSTKIAVVNASGLVTSTSACGGTVVVRARASNSTNTVDSGFAAPDAAAGGADDGDSNGNTDANDAACIGTDPLCDQVTLTIPRASPLPPGYTTAACDAL